LQNVRQRGTTWHVTLALDACMAHLGPGMDLNTRFGSLGNPNELAVQIWGLVVHFTQFSLFP
jgi:hypothetical protein